MLVARCLSCGKEYDIKTFNDTRLCSCGGALDVASPQVSEGTVAAVAFVGMLILSLAAGAAWLYFKQRVVGYKVVQR